MAFQQGLSGLNAASKALDVISNNVANANNVGFKSAGAQFQDVYAAALNGSAAGVQVGIGTAVSKVSQLFSQGNITPTNNPLDVAINGNGFFRMSNSGVINYTRSGQFELDKSGYIVNSSGYHLTGYPTDSAGKILNATPTDIQIDTSDLQPVQTGSSAAGTGVQIGLNLDSRSTAPTAAFNVNDPTTYNSSTSVTVYDSLGNSHVQTLYFAKTAAGWDMYSQTDGGAPSAATALTFDTSGKLTTTMPLTMGVNFTSASFGGAPSFTTALDLTGSTQYGSSFGVNKQVQDGSASGRLSGITVSADGTVQGRYSNGATRNLGQVVLANFADPNGLLSLGNNFWAESPTSGQPLIGAPSSGSLGQLQAGAVEDSNVDLTAELVSMITQQRNYQANAQTIKTEDQIMQTLVNLR